MYQKPSREEPRTDIDKLRTRFDDLPVLGDYIPVREAYLHKNVVDSSKKLPLRTDSEINRCDEYLRNKWGSGDDEPEAFDPNKLEAALKLRYPGLRRPKPSPAAEHTSLPVVGEDGDDEGGAKLSAGFRDIMVLTDGKPESTDPCGSTALPDDKSGAPRSESSVTREQTAWRGSDKQSESCSAEGSAEGSVENAGTARPRRLKQIDMNRWRPARELPERTSTPRIRAGSKPPLSASAFVNGGVPCLDARCGGACKRDGMARGPLKAPKYFPFQNRTRF